MQLLFTFNFSGPAQRVPNISPGGPHSDIATITVVLYPLSIYPLCVLTPTMPRKSIERPSAMPTRRSARLHKDISALCKPALPSTIDRRHLTYKSVAVAPQKPLTQHISEPQTKKRKTKLAPIDTHVITLECNKEVLGASASNVPPTPISPLSHTPRSSEDLHQREHDLLTRELELKRKSEQLDLQEQKASEMIEKCELKSAETTLALLDEHFTCSL